MQRRNLTQNIDELASRRRQAFRADIEANENIPEYMQSRHSGHYNTELKAVLFSDIYPSTLRTTVDTSIAQNSNTALQLSINKVATINDVRNDFYTNPLSWTKQGILAAGNLQADYYPSAQSRPHEIDLSLKINGYITSTLLFNNKAKGLISTSDQKLFALDLERNAAYLDQSISQQTISDLCEINSNSFYYSTKQHNISLHDTRSRAMISNQLEWNRESSHEAFKLTFNQQYYLAAGFKSDEVKVWDIRKPSQTFSGFLAHKASVKGMQFATHDHNLIATAGGTNDPAIYIWDVSKQQIKNYIKTAAQVTSVHWNSQQTLITTHGYSKNPETSYMIAAWNRPETGLLERVDEIKDNQRTGDLRIVDCAKNPDKNQYCCLSTNNSISFFNTNDAKKRSAKAKDKNQTQHIMLR